MNGIEAIGYLGALLAAVSAGTRTMIPFRIAALGASALLLAYGAVVSSGPVMLAAGLPIPLHAWRLAQMLRLVRDTGRAATGDLSLDWLKPFGTSRRFQAGDVLFLKDDPAEEMYLIESGRFRIAEHGLDLAPGDIVGELGMLSPGNRRTGSLACVEAGTARCLTYAEVRQLYYQNPQFGFYLLRLTSGRLFEAGVERP
ncbi:Crp/Fnr family transcriptional regulator [Methylobacterium sp. Leaf118]|uniref:Crp/Fnr family transcriptional regulator n=1 Tax=Methylobacterium sp. Leaf118 TaxID=2876562 RepID=UPI001E2FE15E|nr:cyclic nucleotide-binding domain-containing protein [Methylobacterium sp. Leaf118]